MDWVTMNGLAKDEPSRREFNNYLTEFKQNPDKWKYMYTYDTFNRRWYYLDGKLREPYQNRL